MAAPKIKPRPHYRFEELKVGGHRKIDISEDAQAGLRALSAAYNFARRHNAKTKKKTDHIVFAGRKSRDGRYLRIHRVA